MKIISQVYLRRTTVVFFSMFMIVGLLGVWQIQMHAQYRSIHGTSSQVSPSPHRKSHLVADQISIVQAAVAAVPAHDYTIPAVTNGLAPVLSTIPTKQNVVFLGIDDGVNKQPSELQIIKDNHIKASLFLADRYIKDNPAFFKSFIASGSLVENHSVDHTFMSKLSYTDQKQQICDEADLQLKQFGRRPVLFRPPYGDYNQNTLRAAADCGMKAVVIWIAKANGGSMQYQVGSGLQAGDIVLMHFRPEFNQDIQAFIDAAKKAGLHTELLEDWLAQ